HLHLEVADAGRDSLEFRGHHVAKTVPIQNHRSTRLDSAELVRQSSRVHFTRTLTHYAGCPGITGRAGAAGTTGAGASEGDVVAVGTEDTWEPVTGGCAAPVACPGAATAGAAAG